jgi:uncharacterized protein YndB with AHSA1/START domain
MSRKFCESPAATRLPVRDDTKFWGKHFPSVSAEPRAAGHSHNSSRLTTHDSSRGREYLPRLAYVRKTRILQPVTQRPIHVFEVYIRTTPERLWAAIVSPEYTRRYFYDGWYESTWQPGTAYRTFLENGSAPFEGTVLEVDPPRRLVYTFHYVGDDDTRVEHPSRVTWEIEPRGDTCKLTVVHDQFTEGEMLTFTRVGGGWPFILSSLKTLLETGEPLELKAS